MRHYKLRTGYNCPTDQDDQGFCHEIRHNATPDLEAIAAHLACILHSCPQPPFQADLRRNAFLSHGSGLAPASHFRAGPKRRGG
jgi:hypothetical protein